MDCAFEYGTQCMALKEKNCQGCVFRKTREELEAGRKRARKLLARLPEQMQKDIKEKYRTGRIK